MTKLMQFYGAYNFCLDVNACFHLLMILNVPFYSKLSKV